jgi:hypothetical protein
MSVYWPDSWVMIKMTHNDQTFYKVLVGWSGGYTQGDSWRLNSGVDHVERVNKQYRFYGASGSCYICHEDAYGLRMSTAGVWNKMKTIYPDNVELMPEQDWTHFDFGVDCSAEPC